MTLGDIENALNMAHKAIEIYPKLSISHVLKGLVLGYNSIYTFDAEKADKDNGIGDIDKAISLESNEFNKARYYQLKSQILLELTNYEEALESIDHAIELNPKTLDIYNSKIRVLLYFDQFEEEVKVVLVRQEEDQVVVAQEEVMADLVQEVVDQEEVMVDQVSQEVVIEIEDPAIDKFKKEINYFFY